MTAPLLHTVLLSQVAATPWRNGGGSTQELLIWPHGAQAPRAPYAAHAAHASDASGAAHAQHWQLRISVATIAADGPFSAYPGVQRWFAVLRGDGLVLDFGSRQVVLGTDSAPLCFDGADAPQARLNGGATLDLNLMLRHGVDAGAGAGLGSDSTAGGLQRADSGRPWRSPAPWRALFTLQTALLHINGAAAPPLPPGTLVWSEQAADQSWVVQPQHDEGQASGAFWLHATPARL